MTNLEQRLRDALEASAREVTPDSLDFDRERLLRRRLAESPAQPTSAITAKRVTLVGLAAAAVTVGALALPFGDAPQGNRLADSTHTLGTSTLQVGQSGPAPAIGTTATPLPTTAMPPVEPSTPRPNRSRSAVAPAPQTTPAAPSTAATPSPSSTEAPVETTAPTSTTTTPPTTTATGPAARMDASLNANGSGRDRSFLLSVAGYVHTTSTGGGIANYTLTFGDGDYVDKVVGDCDPQAPVRPQNWNETVDHRYDAPGTYIAYANVYYCGDTQSAESPHSLVQAKVTVTVTE